jgi:hypothetical protein
MQNFYLSKNNIIENTDYWKENTERDYVNCVQSLISSKPFGDHKFYIFSIVKRVCDTSGIKKMYHQPRLTRPEPLPGTTLIKVNPKYPEEAILIWTLPNQENFGLYQHGKMFADPFVHECIEKFLKNPKDLMRPDPEDLSDEKMRELYKDIKLKALQKKRRKN